MMINKTFFSILAILIASIAYSQKIEFFELDKLYTKGKITKEKQEPEMYAVSNGIFLIPTKIKTPNPEYVSLKREFDQAIIDSVAETKEYNTTLNKFNDLSIVKDKISEFNESRKPFEIKKALLKEAQELALKHHLKDFIYADNEINKEMKTKFLVLSLNSFDMKVHLNKILWKLNEVNKAPKEPVFESTVVLNNLRKEIANTRSSRYTTKNFQRAGLLLGNKINDVINIVGNFTIMDSYFVMKSNTTNFSKKQLVSKNNIQTKKISTEKLLFNKRKLLIQHKESKKMYLVDTNFLSRYAFTVNGKYKGAINLTFDY